MPFQPQFLFASRDQEDLDPEPANFFTVFRHRFGLYGNVGNISLPKLDATHLKSVYRIMGLSAQHELLSEQDVDFPGLWYLIHALIHEPRLPLPASLSDIAHGTNFPSPLANKTFTVTRAPQGSGYLLNSTSDVHEDVPWLLLVPSMTTVMQILRDELFGTSKLTAAAQLVKRGMEFRTMLPVAHSFAFNRSPLPPRTPPCCHVAYTSDSRNYAVYEEARSTVLTDSRARAALLKGGIIWRLAIDTLHPDCVLRGPDLQSAKQFVLPSEHGFLLDDDLTDNEMDFICGTYRILTSTLGYTIMHASLMTICF